MSEVSVHEQVDPYISELRSLVPRMIDMFEPSDLVEQREQFLTNKVRNPSHNYDVLVRADLDALEVRAQQIDEIVASITTGRPLEAEVYSAYTSVALKTIELFGHARVLLGSPDNELAASRYDEINNEMFGGLDENTYRAAVGSLRQKVAAYDGELTSLQQEQLEILPEGTLDGQAIYGLPSNEVASKVESLVEVLYGSILASVPMQGTFTAPEIAKTFDQVLHREFGASAIDWQVTTGGTSINVNPITKTISIPSHREQVTRSKMQGLLVHELGVHALRAMAAEQTDFRLLQYGLPGNGAIEEGLAMVMEQAAEKKYALKGLSYYAIAGMVRFEGYDFRAVHEASWRVPLLINAGDPRPTVDKIQRAKVHTYNVVQRFMRGTDSRPWLKDLVYPNGTRRMWSFMETAADDPDMVTAMLMGKIDPTDRTHIKLLHEARSQ